MRPDHELQLLGIESPCARRILIVDDQAPNLDVLEAILEDDYEIVRADSGPEALRLLEEDSEIDLIISDQRMPEMTGLEFLRESAARFPRIVRMVLTAYADVPPIVDAIESGVARMFLLKPWEPVALGAAVSECLEYKQAQDSHVLLSAALVQRSNELRETIEAQLEADAQIAAGERLALIGRMAAGVTHDLRNQLSVLEMLVTRLPETPDIADEIRRAGDSLRQLSALAEDVTAFAKQHPPALTFTSIDVALFAKQAVDMVSLERPHDRGRITTQLAHTPDHFSGDLPRLTTATLALLRNALEASAADRPVVLEIGNAGGATYIRVDDEGPGLADDEMMVVFEPMYSGFGGEHPGLGLGLANLVARAHGGTVTLESRMPVGLSATIRLARHA